MRLKIDKLWIGILLGIILPLLTFYAIYLFGFPSVNSVTLAEFLKVSELFTRILSLSVIPNVALFFLFVWLNMLNAAKGVLGATMIYAIIVFAMKIF